MNVAVVISPKSRTKEPKSIFTASNNIQYKNNGVLVTEGETKSFYSLDYYNVVYGIDWGRTGDE